MRVPYLFSDVNDSCVLVENMRISHIIPFWIQQVIQQIIRFFFFLYLLLKNLKVMHLVYFLLLYNLVRDFVAFQSFYGLVSSVCCLIALSFCFLRVPLGLYA